MAEKSDGPDDGNTWNAGFAFPSTTRASSMAKIVALRMSAPSRESAVKQWGELLGGELDTTAADLIACSWRESPIRLVVDIDASRPAGPKHVEVAFDDRVTIPADPEPSLGARFVVVAR